MQVTAQQLIAGLTSRGVPLPAALGFVANFIAESGLDPGINEIAPVVPGSRGGFGLPQFTGPRRRAFEAFAQQRGVDPSDVDAQLDFIVQELNTTESAARDPIFNAQTAEQAALEVSRRFLRPGIPRESVRIREARRLAGLPVNEPDPPRASTINGLLRPADVTNGAVTRAGGEGNMQQGLLGQPVQPQQSSGLRDVLRGLLTPDGIATLGTSLALAANAARFRPDPGITASLTRVQEQRRAAARERQQNNRTAEFLRQRGRNDLADAVESGAIPANVAARAALDTGTDSVVVGNALVDRQTGRVIFRNESPPAPISLGQGSILVNPQTGEQIAANAPRPSRAEEQVAALTSIGVPREVAIGVANGQFSVSRDPVSGTVQVVDVTSGRIVFDGNRQQGQSSSAEVPAGTQQPEAQRTGEASFPRAEPDFAGATGVTGIVSGAANAIASFLGGRLPAPQANEATNRLNSLNAQTMGALARTIQDRPALFTLELVRETLPSPSSAFQGAETSLSRVRNTIDLLERDKAAASEVADGLGRFRPEQVAEAREKILQIDSLLREWRTVEQQLARSVSGGDGSSAGSDGIRTTPGGIRFRILE